MPPTPPIRRLAAPLGGALVLGHSDGFSWDEALMVLAPIAILAAVLLYANRKLKLGLDQAAVDPADGGDETTTDTDPLTSS